MKTKTIAIRPRPKFRFAYAIAATLAFTPLAHAQFGGQFSPQSPVTQKAATKSNQLPSQFNSTPFKITNSSTVKPKSFTPPKSTFAPAGQARQAKANLVKTRPTAGSTFLPKTSPQTRQQPTRQFTTPSANSFQQRSTGNTKLPGALAKPTSFGMPRSNPPALGTVTPQTNPGSSPSAPPDNVECKSSSVHFINDIQLPAKEAGEIKKMNFKEGDFVRAGETIAQIDDENFQMLLQSAEMKYMIALDRAENMTASLAAKKKWEVASIEAKKTGRLAASGSKSDSEKRMADYTKEIAYLEMRKADEDRRIALAEAKLALAEKRQVQSKIARHAIRCDFDGYVVELKKHEQEYVQMGEEVMRFARMDRVWVQSVVNVEQLNAHELKNRKVTVNVRLARGETTSFEGEIKFVGLERQAPELLMVKAEVINRPVNGHWVLHPEAEVEMTIHLNENSNSIGTASNEKFNR